MISTWAPVPALLPPLFTHHLVVAHILVVIQVGDTYAPHITVLWAALVQALNQARPAN